MQRAREVRTGYDRHDPEHRAMALTGGCTRDTDRCADARDYQVDLRECCRGHLRQLMVNAVAALRAAGITFWLDYGSLLGAVRNPLLGLPAGLIPHDKDVDLGIFGCGFEAMRRVQQQVEQQGHQVLLRPMGRSLKVRLSARNHTNLDLFLWRERADGKLHRDRYIAVDDFKGREFPKTALFPLTTVEWEGMSLPAPRDPAAFCAFRYGPDWMTPIRANNDGQRRP
jgi:hypothetical protein